MHRSSRIPSPAIVVAVVALVMSVSGVSYAATGGNFILGAPNSADRTSTLGSNTATGPTLNAVNTGGRQAAKFTTNAGVAPFSVSNSARVTNLNSDKLDGLDSTQLIRGKGSNAGGAIGMLPGTTGLIALVPGLFSVEYDCPSDLAAEGVIRFVNTSNQVLNVFADSGGDNPNYEQLAPGASDDLPATANADSFVWQIQGPEVGLSTIHAASANRPAGNDCHLQVQAVVTRP